jgi:hypothetical protein
MTEKDIIDIENLRYIEDSKQRKMYYRFTQAGTPPNKAPILIILHGHGSKKASKFRDKSWNVIAPIDNYGKDSSARCSNNQQGFILLKYFMMGLDLGERSLSIFIWV